MQGPKLTTLCHLEKNGCYLMLHRITKKEDINHNKWIGVGGKFERGESPEECLIREVREETGFHLRSADFRGILTFIYDTKDPEYIFVYTSRDFLTGEGAPGAAPPAAGDCAEAFPKQAAEGDGLPLPSCDEGVFRWVPKTELFDLELWEGDRFMLEYLVQDRETPFSLKLRYDAADDLVEAWEMSAAPKRLK